VLPPDGSLALQRTQAVGTTPGLSSARCHYSRFGGAEGGPVPSFISRS
jgi:hypothetical protein